MGGGGFALHAIKTLKANRALLNKRNRKSKKDVYGQESVTKLNLKESTDQDMKRIRKKIKKYKRQELMTWGLSLIVTALLIYSLIWWMGVS